MKAHGQVRRGQVITTYGPGALIDMPRHSAIVGGLDTWPKISDFEEILEPRLTRKLQFMTGVAVPRLYAPPSDSNDPRETAKGIGAWRFPEWFVVQEASSSDERERSRRLVHRIALDNKGRFDGRPLVPDRQVRRALQSSPLSREPEQSQPADVYFGRAQKILLERERIKRATIQNRRLQHQKNAA